MFPEVGKQGQRQKGTPPGPLSQGMQEPVGTQFCLASARPGLGSSLPGTLGWRQQAGPPGRLCVGPVRRLELPTTYFSGQEPFGVRGLSFGARTIKIKAARTPGQPGSGEQQPQRRAADRLERKRGGAGGARAPHTSALFSDLYVGYLRAPSSYFMAAETQVQRDGVTCFGHSASERPSQLGLKLSSSNNNSSHLFIICYALQACSCDMVAPHPGGAANNSFYIHESSL